MVDRVIGRESGVDMTDPTAAVYTVHSGYCYYYHYNCYYYCLYKDMVKE